MTADIPNTWEGIYAYAKASGAKYPELVAAQWALESSYGKHLAGQNNFFGLKGKNGTMSQTQEWVNGNWVTIKDGFLDFPSRAACVDYLIKLWYLDYKTYKGVNNAASSEAAAKMLKSEGYATDPGYVEKLVRLMREKSIPSEVTPEATPVPKRRPIKLTAAAQYYRAESHQIAAWDFLEDLLTEEQLDEFAVLYRSSAK